MRPVYAFDNHTGNSVSLKTRVKFGNANMAGSDGAYCRQEKGDTRRREKTPLSIPFLIAFAICW